MKRHWIFTALFIGCLVVESGGDELNLNAPDLSPLKTINRSDEWKHLSLRQRYQPFNRINLCRTGLDSIQS